MGREIKFRAWDNQLNCFAKKYDECLKSSIGLEFCTDNYFIEFDRIDGIEKRKTRFNFEQYTGLKDKNGVEIYEGDILENRQYVCYREDLTMFCTRINEKSASTNIHCNCEIIGNIHQNPELLEEKKWNR